MNQLEKRICRTCGQEFMPKCDINVFCSRRCFKKDYYHRKKGEEINAKIFPDFNCPNCGQHITLDFNPVLEPMRWLHYTCCGCNTLMINVSDEIVTHDMITA
jgi:hypothetical protein